MDPRVALINMPFSNPIWPVVGLSLLKSGLAQHNIHARIYYLNLWFAEQMGFENYIKFIFSINIPKQSGEWIFSSAIWGTDAERDEKYIQEILHEVALNPFDNRECNYFKFIEQYQACREQVEPFLQRCMDTIPWQQYKLVGFTSTHHQQLASLALAKRLRTISRFVYCFWWC